MERARVKKVVLFLIIQFSTAIAVNAQIILDSIHGPGPEEKFYRAFRYSNIDSAVKAGNAGPNQTWNFTSLYPEYIDSIYFRATDSTAFSSVHPTANLGEGDSSETVYYRNDANGFFMVGTAGDYYNSGHICSAYYTPFYKIMKWPSMYGQTFGDTLILDFMPCFTNASPNDSIRYRIHYTNSAMADAWGSMQLAGGTYNVIRYKRTFTYVDTIWAHNSTGWYPYVMLNGAAIEYDWWTDDPLGGYRLVHLTMDTVNNVANYVAWLELNGTTTNVAQQKKVDVTSIYPNPAGDFINLTSSGVGEVEIHDVSGRCLLVERNYQGEKIDLRYLPSGIYFVHFFPGDGSSQPCVQRLVIERSAD